MHAHRKAERFSASIFICCDCQRQEHRPDDTPPAGWDVIHGEDAPPVIRCPDCAEMVEQQHFALHEATKPSIVGVDVSSKPDMTACYLAVGEGSTFTLLLAKPRPFHTYLQRQHDGSYRIAMLPQSLNPFRFMLDPADARALAAELIQFADLADHPGTLGSAGEGL